MIAPIETFVQLDIRAGRVVTAAAFPEARKPALRLLIDFGKTLGMKRSSAQITDLYTSESIVGCMVVAVVNFPPKRIAGFDSEVLVLGVPDQDGAIVLLQPERSVAPGSRVY